jgi:hypothetical protein
MIMDPDPEPHWQQVTYPGPDPQPLLPPPKELFVFRGAYTAYGQEDAQIKHEIPTVSIT